MSTTSPLAALGSHLKNTAAISATLTDASDVYQGVAEPGHGAKYVTIHQIPGTRHEHHQGGRTGLVFKQFQVNCWAETNPLDAEAIGKAIGSALDGVLTRGTLGTDPNDMAVTEVRVSDEHDDYRREPHAGTEKLTYGWFMTVTIWHRE